MPIIDRQKKGHQIGEIRIGVLIRPEKGKPYPSKLDTFRFTTKSAHIAEAVATLLGGTARATTLNNGTSTYEVITDVTELPVMVPPGRAAISQWYEQWSAAGCARRCDGETEVLKNQPCVCPADQERRAELAKSGSACKPTTRLNVMLPDLPDLGVWLLTSGGWNAADELGEKAEVLAAARAQGVVIPAKLRLEQREVRKVGEKPKKFAVPVLEIGASLRQMTELAAGSQDITAALPPPPPTTSTRALSSAEPQPTAVSVVTQDPDDEPIEAEVVEDHEDSLAGLIGSLDETQRATLAERMKKANYPAIDKLQGATETQVRRWIAEITGSDNSGRPF